VYLFLTEQTTSGKVLAHSVTSSQSTVEEIFIPHSQIKTPILNPSTPNISGFPLPMDRDFRFAPICSSNPITSLQNKIKDPVIAQNLLNFELLVLWAMSRLTPFPTASMI
jgi:hypothetical protein